MKNNQFAMMSLPFEQQCHELQTIHLLKASESSTLTPNQMWQTLLERINCSCTSEPALKRWRQDVLATPELSLDDWLASKQPLNDEVFYLVGLQLLEFEPAIDFSITDPLAAMDQMQLLHHHFEQWTTADVIAAFYDLLNTHTKNGQTLLDALTAQGLLKWTHKLSANQKPIFFNGKSLAVFDPHDFIYEVVYVETDVDTDFDDQADLVKVEIMRPAESNQGLKVPAVFTASPYNQGTNDEWGVKATHNVNQALSHKEPDQVSPAEPTFNVHPRHQMIKGSAKATETFSQTPAYTLNDYLAPRGFASVYCAGIGTRDSDGLQTCGSPEQVESMQAVVEWLHGDRTAFSDRTSGLAVKADWCNGNVAMTGRSYLGTLSTAVATTGVKGLKAIISEAAISSWYDYYRENGLVRAAGGFQGEDADTLAAECFSRTKRPGDYRRVEQINNRYLAQMNLAMDRQTGNYNDFWERRNYRKQIDQIKASVMMVHGLNDDNVKPSNVKALYDGLKKNTANSKLILHQGKHIYINAFRSLDFTDMVNLWLSNKLWEIDNHADDLLPAVLVQDNATPETWTAYQNWDEDHSVKFYLNVHQKLSEKEPLVTPTRDFTDYQWQTEIYQDWCAHPAHWKEALLSEKNRFSLSYQTAPLTDDYLLRGTPTVKLRAASDHDHGLLSVFLIDQGSAKRLTENPVLLSRNSLSLGYHWKYDDLREFRLQNEPTPYKVISYGHINLQNPHDPAITEPLYPNEFVDLTLPLQPVFHRLLKGHQLRLVICGTDYEMTLRGNEKINYQIMTENSALFLPDFEKLS